MYKKSGTSWCRTFFLFCQDKHAVLRHLGDTAIDVEVLFLSALVLNFDAALPEGGNQGSVVLQYLKQAVNTRKLH